VLLPAAWPESLSFRWGCRRYACQFGSGGDPQGGIRHTAVLAATFLQASDAIKFRALHRSVCCTRPALLSDLRIARMLRGTRPVQAFLALRKRPEFLFPAQVLFAGFRRPAHTGKAMVFRGHLIMVSLPREFPLPGRRRSERRGTLERVHDLEANPKGGRSWFLSGCSMHS
jgi:hypothetical protein